MPLPVQTKSATVGTNAGSTISATFTSNVTLGNFIVVCSESNGLGLGAVAFTISDNLGNVYTNAVVDASKTVVIASAPVTHAGACTVTVNCGRTGLDQDIIIAEYAVSSGTPTLDKTNSASVRGSTIQPGSITTTSNTELVVCMALDNSSNTITWLINQGFAVEVTSQNPDIDSTVMADLKQTVIGTYNPTWSGPGASDGLWAAIASWAGNFSGGAPASPTISCNNPPLAHIGRSYSHTFPASGGTPPYTNYAIISGSLPPGLSLNATTGVVSGTPTTAGTYTFTIQVTDSTPLTGSTSCSITVNTNNGGPVFISASAGVSFGQFFSSNIPSFFAANSALYAVQQIIGSGGANINGTSVFKTLDSGDTWTQMNQASAPTAALGWPVQDTANNKLTFGLITQTFPVTAQSLFLKDYNFATDTWGANYATGGPSGENPVQFTFKRPDGSIVVIYDFGPGNPGGTSRLRAAVWNGATWSASIDVGAAILPFVSSGNIVVNNTVAAMDSTGRIHIAFADNNFTTFMYQALNTNNTLGSSFKFTQTFQTNKYPFGTMIIYNNSVYISAVTNASANNTLLVGAPLNAPVWTANSPVNLIPSTAIHLAGEIATDGTNLVWVLNFGDPTTSFEDAYQIAQSNDNGNTWTVLNTVRPYLYDFAASPLAPNTDPTFAILDFNVAILNPYGVGPTMFAGCNAQNTVAGFRAGYFMNFFPVTSSFPSPPSSPFQIKTLRFEIPKKRWFAHSYADTVVLHYLDELFLGDVDNEQLLMLSSALGFIYRSGGDMDNGTAVTSIVTTPSMDGGDDRMQKLFMDIMTDMDGNGTLNAYAQFNNQTVNGPNVTYTPIGPRLQQLQNISSLSSLNLYRNIAITYQWTGGPDGPRLFVCEPAGYVQPYISTFWVTQYINLAFPGWKHHRRLYAGYISNTTLLFTIKTQDGRTYGPYTLPSTGGQFKIIPLMLDQDIKDLAFAYQIDGQGNNFVLFPESWTIETKEWNEPSYIPLAIFKT